MHVCVGNSSPGHSDTSLASRDRSHFSVVVRALCKIHSLSNFQVYSTLFLTVFTVLYITSPELVHSTARHSYPLTNISPFSKLPSPRQTPFFSLLLWVQLFKILRISEIMRYLSFSAWVISLLIMPSGFIPVVTNGRISSFYMAE